ncbi:MAG: hypothetical protein JST89_22710 [Cyanobacteria bacterium SZAS-4]|nr:hypothetical protein [Cyanobacteria bacterium SZAS-4]
MKKEVTLACATFAAILILQSAIPAVADSSHDDASDGVVTGAQSSAGVVTGVGSSNTVVTGAESSNTVVSGAESSSGVVTGSEPGTMPGEAFEHELLRDGIAAPLVYLTPDMPLNAALLMPVSEPSALLKGEAKVSAPTSENTLQESTTASQAVSTTGGIIIIDNDLENEAAVTEYVWKEIPDSDGKMHIDAGGRFPVTVVTSHTSKTAKVGDPVEARLKVDIKIGGRLIAPKGAKVIGHIASCERARRMIQAEISMKRWMRPSGALGVQFDEILTANGEHIPLVAMPAQQPRIVKNMAEGRVLGVNHKGEIASPLSSQVKAQAAHIGIRAAASAAGPFSFGIVPVAYGVAGAISPSFAFMHPVGKNVRHRRLKGFSMGVLQGMPGGFLVADYMIRGDEAIIKPGDEFLAEFKQKFTGETATDAQLMPGAKVKVHGEVMPGTKPKK